MDIYQVATAFWDHTNESFESNSPQPTGPDETPPFDPRPEVPVPNIPKETPPYEKEPETPPIAPSPELPPIVPVVPEIEQSPGFGGASKIPVFI